MSKNPRIKTVEMMLCESCGQYHPIDDMETVVIKITKGKDCDLEGPKPSRATKTDRDEPIYAVEQKVEARAIVVPSVTTKDLDVTRPVKFDKFTPEIAKTHNADGQFDGIVQPPREPNTPRPDRKQIIPFYFNSVPRDIAGVNVPSDHPDSDRLGAKEIRRV